MTDAPPKPTTRLRKSNPLGKGYHRVRAGRGFSYRAPDGTTVTDPALRERFEALGIPPAWTDVWIAPYENGHIQAVGHDAANRKQYMYHPTWRERHDKNKYRRMLLLAEALPGARGTVRRHLRDPEEPRRQVLAAAFRMLDLGGLRIGSSIYEEENGSYGLTTLHGEHVRVDGDVIDLRFPAKSHKLWESTMRDEDLAPLLAGLKARGDDERLLAYDHGGRWHTIAPEDVNGYVRERLHGEFSAKDFRTLRGTVAAATSLAKHGPESKKGAQKRAIADAMRAAAAELSNTPTVAKASYVDPRVVDRYRAGETIDPARLHAAESEVLALLFERPGSPIAKPKRKRTAKS
ncbi:DNA topoisomerase IB [Amnibacterium kyonggiense]|uniref:DNA topoisomerase n=1 Tax=Amnibacterium kyonggiense TaxID=595671 RepID=A0A4R7FQQ7_9MICO|nr:DNA topoisomerase IB [Amnibacterium kyonggiense]TDS80120.1 DNA topoisomerase-1 [Amnibacterium kyonggiense]